MRKKNERHILDILEIAIRLLDYTKRGWYIFERQIEDLISFKLVR